MRGQKRKDFTQFHGITRDPSNGKWRAYIPHPEKPQRYMSVGSYEEAHSAALAWDRGIMIFGLDKKMNFSPAVVEESVWKLMLPPKGMAQIYGPNKDKKYKVHCICGHRFAGARSKSPQSPFWRCESCGRKVFYDGRAQADEGLIRAFNPESLTSSPAPKPKPTPTANLGPVIFDPKYPHSVGMRAARMQGVHQQPSGRWSAAINVTHQGTRALLDKSYTVYLGGFKDKETAHLVQERTTYFYGTSLRGKNLTPLYHTEDELRFSLVNVLQQTGKKASVSSIGAEVGVTCSCGHTTGKDKFIKRGRPYIHCAGCGSLINTDTLAIDGEGWLEKLRPASRKRVKRMTPKPDGFDYSLVTKATPKQVAEKKEESVKKVEKPVPDIDMGPEVNVPKYEIPAPVLNGEHIERKIVARKLIKLTQDYADDLPIDVRAQLGSLIQDISDFYKYM